jgi:hypothetical protein
MSKWTKGEWRPGFNGLSVVSDCNNGLYLSGTTGELAIDYYGGNLIAESVTPCKAKLIAQAPVLADELSNLMDILDAILSDPEVANVQGCHCTQTDVDAAYKALQDAGYYD